MRSDLTNIEGLSHIQTDIRKSICKFRLADSDLDLTGTLDGFAKKNSHLRGWSRLQ